MTLQPRWTMPEIWWGSSSAMTRCEAICRFFGWHWQEGGERQVFSIQFLFIPPTRSTEQRSCHKVLERGSSHICIKSRRSEAAQTVAHNACQVCEFPSHSTQGFSRNFWGKKGLAGTPIGRFSRECYRKGTPPSYPSLLGATVFLDLLETHP